MREHTLDFGEKSLHARESQDLVDGIFESRYGFKEPGQFRNLSDVKREELKYIHDKKTKANLLKELNSRVKSSRGTALAIQTSRISTQE